MPLRCPKRKRWFSVRVKEREQALRIGKGPDGESIRDSKVNYYRAKCRHEWGKDIQ